jgi:hypothetical protein
LHTTNGAAVSTATTVAAPAAIPAAADVTKPAAINIAGVVPATTLAPALTPPAQAAAAAVALVLITPAAVAATSQQQCELLLVLLCPHGHRVPCHQAQAISYAAAVERDKGPQRLVALIAGLDCQLWAMETARYQQKA